MRKEQPNLIYIVKPEEVPSPPKSSESYPNFTILGASDLKAAAASAIATDVIKPTLTGIGLRIATMFATRAALAVVPGGLPISVLVAVATYSPAIMQFFTTGKDEIPKDLQKELEKQGTEDVEAFMREHAFSLKMVEETDLIFPPGHPQIGMLYRRHPLAGVKSTNKLRVYIPAERYDEILLEEHEAELLRLLVHLGATQISITKKRRTTNLSKLSATLSASVSAANWGNRRRRNDEENDGRQPNARIRTGRKDVAPRGSRGPIQLCLGELRTIVGRAHRCTGNRRLHASRPGGPGDHDVFIRPERHRPDRSQCRESECGRRD